MTVCERCGKESAIRSMSWFNTQMICRRCYENEQAHPSYNEAVIAERQALMRGERNFPGIGLPDDLR